MGWVTLAARKQSLRLAMSNLQMRDLELSRQLRSMHRSSSYEQSIIKNNRAADLKQIKDAYDKVRNARPESMDDPGYNDWYLEYQAAREDYEHQKMILSEEYDDKLKMLEEEVADKEADIQQEQTTVEAQLEAMKAEFDVVSEQISQEIEDSVIKI
jgi:hypothetical protein